MIEMAVYLEDVQYTLSKTDVHTLHFLIPGFLCYWAGF